MPKLVSDRTVNLVRRTLLKSLTDSAKIEREVATTDDMGAPLHTIELVATDVVCRVIRAGQQTQNQAKTAGGAETIIDKTRIILKHDVTIDVDYLITVRSVRYQVVTIDDNMTDAGFVSAICVRAR